MEDKRFSDNEIIVLSYLAKYNCSDLGFRSNAELYRKLSSITNRSDKSLKTKYDNIVNEYYRAGIEKETNSKGTSGTPRNSTTQRWTERERWERYINLDRLSWANLVTNILNLQNPPLGIPESTEPIGPEGYVYAIINPAFEGWVKVGQSHEPDRRLESYKTGDPYRNYQKPYEKKFSDRKVAENMAHEALKKITDEWNGEWFKLELQVVQNIISELTI